MTFHPSRILLPLLAACPLAAPAASHDLYLAASINASSRVMGARGGAFDGLYARGPDNSFGHIGHHLPLLITLAFDPRDSSRVYGAGLSGVMRSTDGGDTWRIVTDWQVTEPKALAVDAMNPDTVYAGLPDGFIVSDDCGETWERREAGLPERGKYTQSLQVDRTRAGRVFAGCETGIYLTESGARSWRRVFETVDTVNDIQQSPHDPAHWIAVSQSAGALESRDSGLTWKSIPGVPSEKALYNVAFDPTQRGRIAIASWTYGIFTSEDDGRTWAERNTGLPPLNRVWRTAVDPDDGRLYAAVYEQALYASSDFGRIWQSIAMEGSVIRNFIFVPRAR
ncbi:MAG TPA: YCF48-related protein [Opitutaceae bacterium]